MSFTVDNHGMAQAYDVDIGERLWFEYHCNESHSSPDAPMWYRSHRQCVVLKLVEAGEGASFVERGENGQPAVFKVRFDDGFKGDAFEDELTRNRSDFCRPDPPKPHVESISAANLAARLLEDEEDDLIAAKDEATAPEFHPWHVAYELGFLSRQINIGLIKIYGSSPKFRLIVAVSFDKYRQWGSSRDFADMVVRLKIGIRANGTEEPPKWTSYTDWVKAKLTRGSLGEFNNILISLNEELEQIAAGLNEEQDAARVQSEAYRALGRYERLNVNP